METDAVLKFVHQSRVVGAFTILCACDAEQKADAKIPRREIISFDEFAERLSDRHFKRVFRMSRAHFYGICKLLTDSYRESGRVLGEAHLPVSVRLSMTLRWLAGGSYLDISLWHNITVSTFYYILDQTISDLEDVLRIKFPYADESYLDTASMGFSRGNRSPLTGCVGAVDGIAIQIEEPKRASVPNPSTYYNRKGFFALCVQAMCDSQFIFRFASATTPGSTHDSVAFEMSSLSDLLRKDVGGLPHGYWIAADDADVCGKRVVTPWPGRNLSRSKDAFNYWQSSARIFIEQAFGMLVARWGVLWRPLRVPINKSTRVVIVCMKLHNYIIEFRQGITSDSTSNLDFLEPSEIDNVGHAEPANKNINLQDEHDTDVLLHKRRRDKEECVVRSEFTKMIGDLGLSRPF
jgi:DDE superfamily endonuclease